jgi:hypothetical protein
VTGDPTSDESRLVGELAARHWLRGDAIQAVARAQQLDRDRYKVSGLDVNGQALAGSAPERAVEGTLAFFTDDRPDGYVAVSGGHPRCAAVGLYQATRFDHAWLVITPYRLAVLRLRDVRNTQEGVVDAIVERPGPDKSLGGFLRGVGKIVKTSTEELVQSARRPPLVERPQDAVLECPFEIARQALHSIVRWKQPLVPQFRGGPRFVQVSFTDGSWARLQTDEAGQSALTG